MELKEKATALPEGHTGRSVTDSSALVKQKSSTEISALNRRDYLSITGREVTDAVTPNCGCNGQ